MSGALEGDASSSSVLVPAEMQVPSELGVTVKLEVRVELEVPVELDVIFDFESALDMAIGVPRSGIFMRNTFGIYIFKNGLSCPSSPMSYSDEHPSVSLCNETGLKLDITVLSVHARELKRSVQASKSPASSKTLPKTVQAEQIPSLKIHSRLKPRTTLQPKSH
jgi:hypothetical protein